MRIISIGMIDPSDQDFTDPVPLPIDGALDLHTFAPREVKQVVLAYLDACQERGILEVRIIHGKGIGNLQRTVHALLGKHPEVVSFVLASQLYGGSGATIARLRPRDVRSNPNPA